MFPALSFLLSPSSSALASASSSFFARDNNPPPPSTNSLIGLRRAPGPGQMELERRMRHLHPPPTPTAALDLHLSTTCTACGEPVAVEVPRWILAAIEGAQQSNSYAERREDGGWDASRPQTSSAAEWRAWIVKGAVQTAHAVRASPLPGLILAFVQTLFAVLLYLDTRFSIHQRLALALGVFLEGLVEIEKEVGIMRGAGEALSIGWEAMVKGIIAFAKAGSTESGPAPSNDPDRARTASHTPRASSPVGSRYGQDTFPPSDSLPGYETSDSECRYYDSVSTTRISSPVLGPSRGLHRNFVSSPSLQSAYLSSMSPTSSPTLVGTPTAPVQEGTFPVNPSEALLSPFVPASQSRPHVRPRIVRQRSATGPDAGLSVNISAHDHASLPAPPPSPTNGVAPRGGWAGKAVLGLAERMKVL